MALLKAQGACYRDRSEIRHLAATPAFRFAPAAQAERPGGRQIHGQLEFGRRLHRKLGGLGALEDAIDVSTRAAKDVRRLGPVRQQPALPDDLPIGIDRGDAMPRAASTIIPR